MSTLVVTSVVVTGVVVGLRQLGALEEGELNAYDKLMQLRPSEGVDDRLLVVGISEEDIQTRNEFPIKDITLAQLLQKLNTYQPHAIGIDIARDVPQGSGREELIQQLKNSDRIIAACVLTSDVEPGIAPPPGVPPERIGFADFPPADADGVVRRSILLSIASRSKVRIVNPSICSDPNLTNPLLSLGLSLALPYLQQRGMMPSQTASGDLKIGPTIFNRLEENAGGYHRNGATDYQIMLNYRGVKAIRQVTLTDVLQGRVDPNWVRDRIVLIGYTSTITKDIFFTPLNSPAEGGAVPGVVIHAQSVSQILSAVLDHRPLIWYWPKGIEALWILGWSVVGGAIAWRIQKTWRFLLAEGIGVGVLCAICYILFLLGGWIPLVPPAIALLGSAIGVILVERANREGYTQALYEQVRNQVKGVLKPKIEIDQEKRAKQVAEITETSYFQDLVQRAKEIREKRANQEARSDREEGGS
jgi:CHASE2 domain-containing sensor protein